MSLTAGMMDLPPRAGDSQVPQKDITTFGETRTATTTDLMDLPEEIVRIIFTEFLSKPALHFARFNFSELNYNLPYGEFQDQAVFIRLGQWHDGALKSGYVSADALKNTCSLARDVALKASVEPSMIPYDDGPRTIDASTDLVCLVHRRTATVGGGFPTLLPGNGSTWYPKLDYGRIGKTLGTLHHAGVQVGNQVWHNLLTKWFRGLVDAVERLESVWCDGDLQYSDLAALMTCFPDLKAFYIVLTEITQADWAGYYASRYID